MKPNATRCTVCGSETVDLVDYVPGPIGHTRARQQACPKCAPGLGLMFVDVVSQLWARVQGPVREAVKR
jgi:hypothetical protein